MKTKNITDILVYIDDIAESVSMIENYTRDIEQADFFDDTKIQDAVMRRLTIIGEAVKRIPDNFKEQHPDILWREIAGTRDKLIHEYSGIKLGLVWDVIINDIPVLKKQIELLLKEFSDKE